MHVRGERVNITRQGGRGLRFSLCRCSPSSFFVVPFSAEHPRSFRSASSNACARKKGLSRMSSEKEIDNFLCFSFELHGLRCLQVVVHFRLYFSSRCLCCCTSGFSTDVFHLWPHVFCTVFPFADGSFILRIKKCRCRFRNPGRD